MRHLNAKFAELATKLRLLSSRLQFVTLILFVIAVIDFGNVQTAPIPGPCGFTRIARDLSRKFQNSECERLSTSENLNPHC
jgi:hypothetical protein